MGPRGLPARALLSLIAVRTSWTLCPVDDVSRALPESVCARRCCAHLHSDVGWKRSGCGGASLLFAEPACARGAKGAAEWGDGVGGWGRSHAVARLAGGRRVPVFGCSVAVDCPSFWPRVGVGEPSTRPRSPSALVRLATRATRRSIQKQLSWAGHPSSLSQYSTFWPLLFWCCAPHSRIGRVRPTVPLLPVHPSHLTTLPPPPPCLVRAGRTS